MALEKLWPFSTSPFPSRRLRLRCGDLSIILYDEPSSAARDRPASQREPSRRCHAGRKEPHVASRSSCEHRVISARATRCGFLASGAEGIIRSVVPFRLAGRWLPAGCLGDLLGVQDHASPDHAMNAPCIPDVALRIGVQDQQIGGLAGFDGA